MLEKSETDKNQMLESLKIELKNLQQLGEKIIETNTEINQIQGGNDSGNENVNQNVSVKIQNKELKWCIAAVFML
jgi:hypothetical protein